MDLYIETPKTLIEELELKGEVLNDILAFRYDNLQHSLDYVKALWVTTRQYVDSAIQIFTELNALSTRNSVEALTLITSIGIVNLIPTFLASPKYPAIPTKIGLVYIAVLLVGSLVLHKLLIGGFSWVRYRVTDIKLTKNFR